MLAGARSRAVPAHEVPRSDTKEAPSAARKSGLAGLLLATGAEATLVDFEGLTTGVSVNGQAGWTVEDEFGFSTTPFDETVVDDGTGNTVWRMSNAVGSTGFSDQPFSHSSPLAAGESGSALWNARGTDHTAPLSPPDPGATAATDTFHAGFRFRSATGAAQSGLSIDVSPAARQSSLRNGFIRLTDDGATGIDINFFETGVESDPFGTSSVFPEIASDLAYDEWHTVEMYIEFIDGAEADTTGNDIMTVLVDGTLVHTGSTWESFYRGGNLLVLDAADLPHRQAVDSLIFHYRGADVPGTAGNGFFFDDVVIDNAALQASVPAPGTAALLAAGALLLGGSRRRGSRC